MRIVVQEYLSRNDDTIAMDLSGNGKNGSILREWAS